MKRQAIVRSLLLALSLIPLVAKIVGAHDIPADAQVHIIVKPHGNQLDVLVRAPLKSMLDVNFPKRGPGFLDIAQADSALRDAATLWIASSIDVDEGHVRLTDPRVVAVRASLESDVSFRSYDRALGLITGPRLLDSEALPWDQAMLDTLLEYSIHSDRASFSIHPRLGRLGLKVDTSLVFVPPNGGERAFMYTGDEGVIRLDPRWYQAASRFASFGFSHILSGADHLLFLLCLLIPIRRVRPLIVVVTSFTLGHSISLMAAASGLTPSALWFPPLIETLIAGSILYMAVESIVSPSTQRRWMVAFGFGLIHGLGFSFALERTLQFAGSHLVLSLASFNLGVELGQILALAVMVPALHLGYRLLTPARRRVGLIVLSAFVAHTAWHWMVDRGGALLQYRFEWPAPGASQFAALALWLLVATFIAGSLWLVSPWMRRITGAAQDDPPDSPLSERKKTTGALPL